MSGGEKDKSPFRERKGLSKWLPQQGSSGRIVETVVIDLAEARKRLRPAPRRQKRKPKIHETLALAEAWGARLEAGGVNRADLARERGVSRARVSQILKLLSLHPAIRAFAVAHPALASEHRLRPLLRLSPKRQLAAARRSLPRFHAYLEAAG
jgi:hypothetical protein